MTAPFSDELLGLRVGDMVEGGTFMQALDDEPMVWMLIEREEWQPVGLAKYPKKMVFSVSWRGIDLGTIEKTTKGVERADGQDEVHYYGS